ncbi:MAG TPA: cupin domain-containing protein [Candidatus Binataceae bacterium]|nr:cupin domain-containing protein [Candidatus Binataceae bacterium]
MDNRTNVVNEASLPWTEAGHGARFHCLRKQLSAPAGGRKLGCSLYELAPGKSAWPAHYHTANEEAIYILEGAGTLRLGGREIPLARGDYVALLPAADAAHRLANTSDKPLRYLCFSTMIEPEVTVYPDSNKIGISVGAAPGGPREKRTLAKSLRADAEVDYWDGER